MQKIMDLRYKKLRLWAAYPLAAVYLVFAYNDGLSFFPGFWFIVGGLIIRFWAAGYIHKIRKLTTSGPYAFVRNPLYVGNFLVGLGFCLFVENIFFPIAYTAIFAFLYLGTIRKEEELLAGLFGAEYLEYKKNVPAFIPTLKKYPSKEAAPYSLAQAHFNGEPIRIIASGIIITLLYFFYTFIAFGAIGKSDIAGALLLLSAQLILLYCVIRHRRNFIKQENEKKPNG